MQSDLGAIAIGLAAIAVLWLVRRFAPKATCPGCGSEWWTQSSDTKQCNDCGHLYW